MPCHDYIPDSVPESHEAAQLICYVSGPLGLAVPEWVQKAAKSAYGDHARNGELTEMLCSIIRTMHPALQNAVMYNGRIPDARRLAEWWEKHEEHDEKRPVDDEELRRGMSIFNELSLEDRVAVIAYVKFVFS